MLRGNTESERQVEKKTMANGRGQESQTNEYLVLCMLQSHSHGKAGNKNEEQLGGGSSMAKAEYL